jgi:hypothetical protein
MDEAIELAIQERSPYPEKSLFIDAHEPDIGSEIRRAADEGRAVVLVDPDGTIRTLLPELAHRQGARVGTITYRTSGTRL